MATPVAPLGPSHQWPSNRATWQEYRRSPAETPGRHYGGIKGDAGLFIWISHFIHLAVAAVVAAFSWKFASGYKNFKQSKLDHYYPTYYTALIVFGAAIISLVGLTLYLIWTWRDSVHAMRKSFWTMHQNLPDGLRDPRTGLVSRPPNTGTLKIPLMGRFTTSRLFANSRLIKVCLIVYAVLFVLWFIWAVLLAYNKGYIDRKNGYQVVCNDNSLQEDATCWYLAIGGISTGIAAVLFLIDAIICLVVSSRRGTFAITQGPVS